MSTALQLVGPDVESSAAAKLGLKALTPDFHVEPRSWLVEGLWPEKAVGFIGGSPKAGKSWLALDLAIALATGQDFLGRGVKAPERILFFSGEEYLGDVALRIDRLLAGRRLTRGDMEARFLLSDAPLSLEDGEAKRLLVEAVNETNALMVFIDPLARFLRQVDENDASQMRAVNNFLRQDLNRTCGVGVCVVHHTDKKDKDLRGTGDLRALSEVTLRLGWSKQGNLRIKTELRNAPSPEPFAVQLVDGVDGSLSWQGRDSAGVDGRAQKARTLLSEVGAEGITLDKARDRLGVRREAVKSILEGAGGAPEGPSGRWVLAQPKPE